MDYHITTINIMLKVHDDMLYATNTLINQTDVHHEKYIQRLEKEIRYKDTMNMVMQEVLIKVIHAAQRHLNVSNYKFDEMLLILYETFAQLKA